jgi:MoxR-like ATPase
LLKTVISYPTREQERQIIELAEKTTFKPMTVASLISHTHLKNLQHATAKIYIDDSIKQYITDLVFASRQPHQTKIKDFDKLVAYGASPRGSIGLLHAVKAVALLNQRAYVIPEDIKSIAMDVLRHRIIPTYEAQAEGLTSDHLVQQILDNVPVP